MSVSVKARLVNGHISWLKKERQLKAVMARVPPSTAALMRDPAPAASWIDYADLEPIICALDAIDGEAVLRMTREQVRSALLPPMMPVLSKVLSFFNASPAWGLRHMNELSMTSVRGMDFAYQALSDRSGLMNVSYELDREIPTCMFDSCRAGFEALMELCGASGTVGPPERVSPTRARFHISW